MIECTTTLADYSISHSGLKGALSTCLDYEEPGRFFQKVFLILVLYYFFSKPFVLPRIFFRSTFLMVFVNSTRNVQGGSKTDKRKM